MGKVALTQSHQPPWIHVTVNDVGVINDKIHDENPFYHQV